MGQIILNATGTFGSDTLSGSITFDSKGFHTGTFTATNSYADVFLGDSLVDGAPAATLIENVGAVDVSVRIQYSSTKYAFLNCPANTVLCIPMNILDGSSVVRWDGIALKAVSGTADINYCVIR